MNSNPALHTNCEVLKEVIPGVVMETLGEPPPRTLKLPPSACTCSLQVQTPTNPVRQHPEGCVATPASAHAPVSLPAWCHPTPHHPVTSRRGGRSPFPRTALPGSASSSPPDSSPDLALETFQKSLRSEKMLPLLSQRRFVLLHNGETDLWPCLGGSRNVPRPPLPPLRPTCDAAPLEPLKDPCSLEEKL